MFRYPTWAQLGEVLKSLKDLKPPTPSAPNVGTISVQWPDAHACAVQTRSQARDKVAVTLEDDGLTSEEDIAASEDEGG